MNGVGNYGFILTAIGEGSAGVVYDNQLNASETADPTTIIGGGSIFIRKLLTLSVRVTLVGWNAEVVRLATPLPRKRVVDSYVINYRGGGPAA